MVERLAKSFISMNQRERTYVYDLDNPVVRVRDGTSTERSLKTLRKIVAFDVNGLTFDAAIGLIERAVDSNTFSEGSHQSTRLASVGLLVFNSAKILGPASQSTERLSTSLNKHFVKMPLSEVIIANIFVMRYGFNSDTLTPEQLLECSLSGWLKDAMFKEKQEVVRSIIAQWEISASDLGLTKGSTDSVGSLADVRAGLDHLDSLLDILEVRAKEYEPQSI